MDEFASLNQPVGLVWTDAGFIASFREGDETKLVRISVDGKTIEPVAPSFTGEGEVYIAVSSGKAGFPEGYLYVSSGNSIYVIDPSGNDVRLFSTPFEAMGLGYIVFDTVGTWGNLLYAVNYNGLLWRIDSNGNADLVIDLGNDLLPEHILVLPEDFGSFEGDLLVSLEMGRKIIAISNDDISRATVLAEFPEESPERVLIVPSESNLYLAKYEENVIVRIPAYRFNGYEGWLAVVTEGEAGENGSITLMKAEDQIITIIKMADGMASPHFEGATFVPMSAIQTVTQMTTVQTLSTSDLAVLGGMAAAITVLIFVFVQKRHRPKA
jgi:hypothetical protein